ncbi:hypothetical protein Hanom_Chr11g01025491 [Helianthus anomalus]
MFNLLFRLRKIFGVHECSWNHVGTFWNSARYEESDKSIYYVVRKKDENGKDVDLEI